MKKFPDVIYITRDQNSEDEVLLAWSSLESADEGRVGVYRLDEELAKREATEVRKKGTKTWFKP